MLEHKHLIVRAEVLNPPSSSHVGYMHDWFKKLISDIGMKILNGPHVTYLDVEGNRGMTGVCIIETSHVAMHVWDENQPGLMQFDVYTCGPLDPKKVFEALSEFNPIKIEWKYLDREHGLNHIDHGMSDYAAEYHK